MFLVWQGFGEDVGSLLGITAAIDNNGSILYKLANPMPAEIDMLGVFVELRVSCHHN